MNRQSPQTGWKALILPAIWFLFGLAAVFGHVRRLEDFAFYATTGRLVLSGRDIYSFAPNTWPPFFSLFCVPLALVSNVSDYLAVAIWSALNAAALLVICYLGVDLAYGPSPRAQSGRLGAILNEPGAFVPMLLTLPYLTENFQAHQINLIILALALGGLWLEVKGKPVRGGIALGAAAALKVMPIVFVPYLVWRRRWRAAAAGAAAAIGLSISPMAVFGWHGFWNDAARWFTIAQHGWNSEYKNQSVAAMWDRIIGYKLVPFLSPGAPPAPWSGNPWVRVASGLTLAAVGIGAFVAFRKGAFRHRRPANSESQALEWSVLFLVAAIFSPVTWRHYFVVLLLPNILLYAIWRSENAGRTMRRVAGAGLLICFLAGLTIDRWIVGSSLSERLLTASIATDAALLMLAALLFVRFAAST